MIAFVILVVFTLISQPANSSPVHCRLVHAQQAWSGPCAGLFGERPRLTLSEAGSLKSGRYQSDKTPTAIYAGSVRRRDEAIPLELEVYAGGTGILRPEGQTWLPVTNLVMTADALDFDLDPDKTVPPSDLDRKVVVRASAILSSLSAWDRADDRECSPQDRTWSIYCAMIQATLEVTGGIHHRRPAMELVREVIEERTAGRQYEHRLMDYNNDPTTTLGDVQSAFEEALKRLDAWKP